MSKDDAVNFVETEKSTVIFVSEEYVKHLILKDLGHAGEVHNIAQWKISFTAGNVMIWREND